MLLLSKIQKNVHQIHVWVRPIISNCVALIVIQA